MRGHRAFCGGWVATPERHDLQRGPDDLRALLDEWERSTIGALEVRHDDTWTATAARAGESEILLLGIAMDVERPDLDQDEVVMALARELDASWDRFLDALDRLAGAHVIFALNGGRLRIIQDATGMEAVCYDVAGAAAMMASHPRLIADLRGYRASEWGSEWLSHRLIGAGGIYFPGLRTLYDEVRMLTPNTSLDAGTLAVERFFPREPLGLVDVDEIVERTAPMLGGQCRWLVDRQPCIVSLSGGLDSRLTLAATREVRDRMTYFTYQVWGNPVHVNDAQVAEKLAARVGIAHETWRVTRRDVPDPRFLEAWQRTHDGAQGGGQFPAGIGAHYPEDRLHIRSNVLETMRGFYLKNRTNHRNRFDAGKLARLFRQGTAEQFEPYFAEYCAVTDFRRETLLDYHYSDLFYWEHRMGGFHAGLVRGMKAVHNTYVLYNCRKLLMLMMARPLADRASGVVVYQLIERLWPEVLEEPVYSGAKFVEQPVAASAVEERAPVPTPARTLPPEPEFTPQTSSPSSASSRALEPAEPVAARAGLRLPRRRWRVGQLAREAVRTVTGRRAQ